MCHYSCFTTAAVQSIPTAWAALHPCSARLGSQAWRVADRGHSYVCEHWAIKKGDITEACGELWAASGMGLTVPRCEPCPGKEYCLCLTGFTLQGLKERQKKEKLGWMERRAGVCKTTPSRYQDKKRKKKLQHMEFYRMSSTPGHDLLLCLV